MAVMYKTGFTLIELLVVIAIISLFSSVILSSLSGVRDQANVSASLAEYRQLKTTVTQYNIDTSIYPPSCRTISTPCTKSNDPLLNDLSVSGWNGPYGSMHNLSHGWGGHIGFERNTSSPSFFALIYDDDPPGGTNDDSGQIPPEAIHGLDERIDSDDGLKNGRVQACIFGISTGAQSAIIFLSGSKNSYSYYSSCLNEIPDS